MTCELLNVGVKKSKLGETIRDLRTTKHLSQGALARLAGVDRQTVANIEMGRTKGMRGAGFRSISSALGMSVEELDALVKTREKSVDDEFEALKELFKRLAAVDPYPLDTLAAFVSKREERVAQPKRRKLDTLRHPTRH
jgi:transcriptional regulator with XRE-family HTH domain